MEVNNLFHLLIKLSVHQRVLCLLGLAVNDSHHADCSQFLGDALVDLDALHALLHPAVLQLADEPVLALLRLAPVRPELYLPVAIEILHQSQSALYYAPALEHVHNLTLVVQNNIFAILAKILTLGRIQTCLFLLSLKRIFPTGRSTSS